MIGPGPAATVVVVAFHRPAPLDRLLAGLADPALERVVVDVEDDPAVAAVCAARGVTRVAVAANVGYAAAVNRGAARAAAPVVVFANDDLEADAATVLRLAGAVAAGEADVAVPRVRDAAGAVERTVAALPTPGRWPASGCCSRPPRAAAARVLRVHKWRLPDRPERIDAASALLVAVRRDLLAATPLPEDYFLYWEESEWFWHLRRAGAVVQYRPDCTVRHLGGRGDVRPEKSRLLAANALRCVRRTQGRPPRPPPSRSSSPGTCACSPWRWPASPCAPGPRRARWSAPAPRGWGRPWPPGWAGRDAAAGRLAGARRDRAVQRVLAGGGAARGGRGGGGHPRRP